MHPYWFRTQTADKACRRTARCQWFRYRRRSELEMQVRRTAHRRRVRQRFFSSLLLLVETFSFLYVELRSLTRNVAGKATSAAPPLSRTTSRSATQWRRVVARLRKKDRFVEPGPLVRLIQRDSGIDDLERLSAKSALPLAARGEEASRLQDALAVIADHEVVVEPRGARMRRPPRHGHPVGARHRGRDHEPVERRALAL